MQFFGKSMENARKHRYIKLTATNKTRSYLVSEPNYHTKKCFSENLLAINMKKIKVKINKSVYLVYQYLERKKPLMYAFWYNYSKPK